MRILLPGKEAAVCSATSYSGGRKGKSSPMILSMNMIEHGYGLLIHTLPGSLGRSKQYQL